MAAPPAPDDVSRDHSSSPPPSAGVRPPPQLKHQEEEEPGSESEFELDSPPPLTIINIPDEPGTPTSPHGGSPPSIDMLPTFGSDTEEWYSLDAEDDPYFKSLVDTFLIAAKDVCQSSEDNIDKKAGDGRQSDKYAEGALKYYNNDKNNEVKYDLISATTSCGIIDVKGLYGHVNFIAKGNRQNSKEELFFAEVDFVRGFPIDAQHCYACGSKLKHPKNGTLYETGHVGHLAIAMKAPKE